jgi:hypothetical protein
MLSSHLASAGPAILHAYWALATSAALIAALPITSMQGFRCGPMILRASRISLNACRTQCSDCMRTCSQACCAAVGGPRQAVGQQATRQSGTSDGEQIMQLCNSDQSTFAIGIMGSMCLLCRMLQCLKAGLDISMRSVLHATQQVLLASLLT